MKKYFNLSVLCILISVLMACTPKGSTQPQENIDKHEADSALVTKINNMSLDEKVGQMLMVGVDGTSIGANEEMFIKDYHVGGFILYGKNISTTSQTVHLINQLKISNEKSNNPFPLFISVDQEGGSVERLPSSIRSLPTNEKVGNTNNQAFSKAIGQIVGMELHDFGFNMDFAPVMDIRRSSDSAINNRSFSSDKNSVSKLGTATMKGIQSKNVISVIKHFPGYGSVTVDAHTDLPILDYGLDPLETTDWVPYKKAIADGADVVMVTHLMAPQLNAKYPASMSRTIMTNILRNRLEFNGVIITDDMTMGAIEKHYSVDQAVVRSVKAGADVVLIAFHKEEQLAAIEALKRAVKDGDIPMKQIDKSVYRIIQLKQKYKLSDDHVNPVNEDKINDSIQTVLDQYLQ